MTSGPLGSAGEVRELDDPWSTGMLNACPSTVNAQRYHCENGEASVKKNVYDIVSI